MPATVNIENTFVDVAGKKTQLMTLGSGPPLLYLHSAGGETECTDFHRRLAEKFTVYVPAHPGFALSEGLDDIRDIQDMAWHYVDLMNLLELRGVPVVGFSLGAWLSAEIKLLRPELIGPTVMIAAAGLYVPGAPMAEIFIDDFAKMRELLFFDPESPVAHEIVPASVNDPRILMWLRAREATARVAWNPYLHDPKLPLHLHRLTSPVQIIWGRHDRLIPLAHGEFYAQHLPHAELAVLEECGHMVPFEKPNEAAQLTHDFFARQ